MKPFRTPRVPAEQPLKARLRSLKVEAPSLERSAASCARRGGAGNSRISHGHHHDSSSSSCLTLSVKVVATAVIISIPTMRLMYTGRAPMDEASLNRTLWRDPGAKSRATACNARESNRTHSTSTSSTTTLTVNGAAMRGHSFRPRSSPMKSTRVLYHGGHGHSEA